MAHGQLYIRLLIIAISLLILLSYNSRNTNYSTTMEETEKDKKNTTNDETKSLSRRRRYLIFSAGSSVQLVFCLTYPMNITIGDIFLMGMTAAMAWELPQEPYGPFRHKPAASSKKDDNQNVYYENTEEFKMNNIHKRDLFEPSIERSTPLISRSYLSNENDCIDNPDFDRVKMHEKQKNREFMNQVHMSQSSVNFHRNSRKGLYNKAESFLTTLGHDGRQCVLKTLCQIGQNKHEEQGTFLDEIVRAIFTLPRGTDFDKEHHREYDKAHASQEDCEMLYPKCKSSIKDIPFR